MNLKQRDRMPGNETRKRIFELTAYGIALQIIILQVWTEIYRAMILFKSTKDFRPALYRRMYC